MMNLLDQPTAYWWSLQSWTIYLFAWHLAMPSPDMHLHLNWWCSLVGERQHITLVIIQEDSIQIN